jgi:hypothetical protein
LLLPRLLLLLLLLCLLLLLLLCQVYLLLMQLEGRCLHNQKTPQMRRGGGRYV